MKKNKFYAVILISGIIGFSAFITGDYYKRTNFVQWKEQIHPDDEIYEKSFEYKKCLISLRRDGKGISATVFYSENGIIAKQSLKIIKDGRKTILTSESARTTPKEQKGNFFSQPFQTECLGPVISLPKHVRTFIFDIYN